MLHHRRTAVAILAGLTAALCAPAAVGQIDSWKGSSKRTSPPDTLLPSTNRRPSRPSQSPPKAATTAATRPPLSPQAVPNICGTYGDMKACINDGAQSHQQTIQLTGITAGTFAMEEKRYNTTDCDGNSYIISVFTQGECVNQQLILDHNL